MKKVTIVAPANIAFVKYWGRRDDSLILPFNSSVSMNLDSCLTTTSCEWGEFENDSIKVKYENKELVELTGVPRDKALKIIERVRQKLGLTSKVRIESGNNFPEATGIASSASGFSALTKSLYEAAGEQLSEQEMTIETRLSGSGSACRSIPTGFVVWDKGRKDDGSDSYAYSVAKPDHWALSDIVCIVDIGNKKVSSAEGHSRAQNPYMDARLLGIEERVQTVIQAIKDKDIEKLGHITEIEALSLHTVCMMSEPPIFYLNDKTFLVMEGARELRAQGIPVYYTMDAGANVHLITEQQYEQKVQNHIKKISGVVKMIVAHPGEGARVV
jgi:diphosphomevalonate decarboxylase